MKKLFIAFALISALFSCKKEATNSNSTTNTTNGVSCGDNPNINFNSIGTPIGKFSDCIKDIDGNVYKTVTIGTQTWMAENLKTSKYNDGTSIPNVKDNNQWLDLTSGAWAYYNNDSVNNVKYGKLYNWYAVSKTTNGNKNVCPTGWHAPSYTEYSVLIDFLGGDKVAGEKMKEVLTTSWKYLNTDATNTSLFTGLPGGNGGGEGFFKFGIRGYFWSSTESTSGSAEFLILDCENNKAYKADDSKYGGLSIRCLKD